MKVSAVSNGVSADTERAPVPLEGISREDLLRAYRTMLLSRRLDDKEIQLKSQSLIFFQISGAGHEAILTAAGMLLQAGATTGSIRTTGTAPSVSRSDSRRARCCSRQWARKTIPPPAGARCHPIGATRSCTSCRSRARPALSACRQSAARRPAGSTNACRRSKDAQERFKDDEVTYVSLGDGSTSEGEFWESLNAACLTSLPVLFLVEDNGYAISVPVDVQTPGGDISRLVVVVSGTPRPQHRRHRLPDVLPHAPRGNRLHPQPPRTGTGARPRHAAMLALSFGRRASCKTPDERAAEAMRDPIVRLGTLLTSSGVASEADLDGIAARRRSGNHGRRRAGDPLREADAWIRSGLYVFSPDVDPTSAAFATEASAGGQAGHDGRPRSIAR